MLTAPRHKLHLPAAATVAARQATATIPIVLVHAGEFGLIESLARPGGNVTGTTSYSPELAGKAVGLLRELVLASSRLAVLVNSSNIGTPLTVREAQLAATSLGMDLTVVGVDRAEDLDAAFATITRVGSDRSSCPQTPCSHRTVRTDLGCWSSKRRRDCPRCTEMPTSPAGAGR